MLVNLFRYILGYVKFSFTGGFNEGFINSCLKYGLKIKNIKIENNVLFAQTDIKTYKQLHKTAFLHGGKVKLLKRKGLPFLIAPLKNRWGVFAGALFFVFYISFMGGFIWNITVTGTDRIKDSQIIEYLAQNGIEIGKRWAATDKENLEFAVLADFKDISWISINRFGSTAAIEINETVPAPNIVDNKEITNIVAKKDGVIMHITALAGMPAVKSGEAVTKGDLLISGAYAGETQKYNHFTHARGTAFAKCEQNITLNISRQQNNKAYTSQKEYKSFYFFGLEMPLYFFKSKGDCDVSKEKSYFLLNSNKLPIAVITRTENYYEINSKYLTDDELEALAKSELEKRKNNDLFDCKIISEEITTDIGADGCLISGKYVFIEDIGREVKLEIENETDESLQVD